MISLGHSPVSILIKLFHCCIYIYIFVDDSFQIEPKTSQDVAEDSQIENTFKDLSNNWDGLDAVIHAVGFAPREELDGDFLDVTSREGFKIAIERINQLYRKISVKKSCKI